MCPHTARGNNLTNLGVHCAHTHGTTGRKGVANFHDEGQRVGGFLLLVGFLLVCVGENTSEWLVAG